MYGCHPKETFYYHHFSNCPDIYTLLHVQASIIFFHLEITEVKTAIVSLSAPFEIIFLGVEDWFITILQTFDLELCADQFFFS